MISKERPKSRTYLLSIWKEEGKGPEYALRYSLKDLKNHERYGFASLEALVAFLKKAAE